MKDSAVYALGCTVLALSIGSMVMFYMVMA